MMDNVQKKKGLCLFVIHHREGREVSTVSVQPAVVEIRTQNAAVHVSD